MDFVGGDLLMLGLTSVLYTILLFVVENRESKKGLFNNDIPIESVVEDGDVANEKKVV